MAKTQTVVIDHTAETLKINPATMHIAKMLVAAGVAGLILWLSPYTFEMLFMGFIAPMLVIVAMGAAIGLFGKSTLDLVAELQNENFAQRLRDALRVELATA